MTEALDGSNEAMNLRETPSFPHVDSSFLTGDSSCPLEDSSIPSASSSFPLRKFFIPTREDKRNAGTHNLSAIPTPITVRSIPWKIQQF